ncbi:hypothetical protein DBR44_10580 [Aquitalea sp. FJL05]|uniref:M48 family metallopeptidase n=1 Tax=Aquitalea TaxID=407217 RepID=UPI000F5B1566|nr:MULTISPECIES: M48 family metallopeptidase [Aquitalea]RQO72768.1 hypothetical protein DBR44_10580 [Aquitalea sp. FJL05]
MSLPGSYMDGRSPVSRAVMLQRDAHHLVFTDGVHTHRYLAREVEFEAGLPGLPDKLQLPDGGVIEVASEYRCRHLSGGLPLGVRLLEWLHSGWQVLAVLALLTVVAVWCGYRYGLPWLADEAARRTPIAIEEQMAAPTISLLERTNSIRPSQLSQARQNALQALLMQAVPKGSRYHYQLRVVDSRDIGANAFALPAGQVILTDQLVKVAKNDEEVFAVLAHEVGHVEGRHGLRGLIQYGGLSLAVTLFSGDTTPMLAVAPIMLADMKYSRDFERDADRYAFRALAARGSSPCVLGQFLTRLSGADGASTSLLASHPGSEERSHPDGQQCPA